MKDGMEAKVIRQRLSPEVRSELIVAAALKLFGTSHFSIVTMRDIAEACDVNVALLYHYFSGKDDLIKRAMAYAIDRIREDFEARRTEFAGDFLRDIGAWFETQSILDPSTITSMVKLIADYAAMKSRDADLDRLVEAFYSFERRLIIATLEEGMSAGRYRTVDAPSLARIVGLQLDGIFHASESRGENRIAGDIADLRALLTELLSNG